ncbi:MAG: metal-sensitive transcriptional regulator [Thermomicrobiales bacterium]|nr:metal-sensitive transcriptional regulator [Thermomicrobiales bacterium]
METQTAPTIDIIEPADQACCQTHHRHGPSYEVDQQKILRRLRRIEGQVRGVQKMVEDEKYCVDILTQISAIVAGLRATGLVILEDHIRGCVLNAEEDEQEAILQELMGAIERFNRSVG